MPLECHQNCESVMNISDLENMCNNLSDVSDTLKSQQCDQIPEYQLEPSQDITKLHDILVANSEASILFISLKCMLNKTILKGTCTYG